LQRLELVDPLPEARVLRGEAAVVLLDVDQVDVIAEEGGDAPRQGGGRVLDGRRDADDEPVRPRALLGRVAHARAEEPERDRQREQDDGKIAVASQVHGGALAFFPRMSSAVNLNSSGRQPEAVSWRQPEAVSWRQPEAVS